MPHSCTDCGRTFEDGSKEMLSGCPSCGGTTFQFQPAGQDQPADQPSEPPEPPEPAVDSTVARTVGNAATAVRDLVGGRESSQPGDSSRPDSRPGQSSRPEPSSRNTGVSPPDSTGSSSASGMESEIEDAAQASARSEVVSPDDLPATPDRTDHGTPPGSGVDSHPPSGPAGSSTTQSSPGAVPDTGTSDSGTVADADTSDDSAEQSRPDLSELREELNDQFESIRVLEPGQYELNLMELYDREEYIVALQEDGKYTIQVPERWQE